MPETHTVGEESALSVADWIADVVVADRDDALRPTAPPRAQAVRPESLLHRVVDAEGGWPE